MYQNQYTYANASTNKESHKSRNPCRILYLQLSIRQLCAEFGDQVADDFVAIRQLLEHREDALFARAGVAFGVVADGEA